MQDSSRQAEKLQQQNAIYQQCTSQLLYEKQKNDLQQLKKVKLKSPQQLKQLFFAEKDLQKYEYI